MTVSKVPQTLDVSVTDDIEGGIYEWYGLDRWMDRYCD
jgi:hypothetical protein